MKNFFLLIMLLVLFGASYAQECGHDMDTREIKAFELNLRKHRKLLKKFARRNLKDLIRITDIDFFPDNKPPEVIVAPKPFIKRIPISAHILRDDQGRGGISTSEIENSLNRVNINFAPIGFEFVLCNTRYIDDTDLFDVSYQSEENGPSGHEKSLDLEPETRNIPETINVYFVPEGTSWTYTPQSNTQRQHIVMQNDHVNNDVTFTHELGHWFNLVHTHGGNSKVLTTELVDGSNCLSAGDYVCDTPADPHLGDGLVKAPSCTYVQDPSVVDANGEMFSPDPSNFMSYAARGCRDNFQDEQYCRMLAAYFTMAMDRGYTLVPCISFQSIKN